MSKGNSVALLPILVFLVLYLGLGILFEYIMKVPMGFYNVPIVVCFLIALLVAVVQCKNLSFDDKIGLMAEGMADRNIVTMILIFMVAGIFVGVVGRSSAESVAYCLLSLIPPQYSALMLFVIACFVSVSMGTSVGTITLLTPIAVAISKASGFDLPLCVGTVVGGAMFGDNLSIISDTTIAVCNGQGCDMQDKFKNNFKVAGVAAILTALLIAVTSSYTSGNMVLKDYSLVRIIPYILVLAGGIAGLNVFLVLFVGICAGIVIALGYGTPFMKIVAGMGAGAAGMFETTMVAIFVAALCALIKYNGGFDAILYHIKNVFHGRKGGKLGIGLLVGAMDIATANNTVAIVIANPIAKLIAEDYGIDSKETASILDSFSCIFQGIIPYGAQMLVALSAATTLGCNITAFDIMPKLYYPYMLGLAYLVYIFFFTQDNKAE